MTQSALRNGCRIGAWSASWLVGHSLLSTTADIYGHLFPQAFAEAADAMDRALG